MVAHINTDIETKPMDEDQNSDADDMDLPDDLQLGEDEEKGENKDLMELDDGKDDSDVDSVASDIQEDTDPQAMPEDEQQDAKDNEINLNEDETMETEEIENVDINAELNEGPAEEDEKLPEPTDAETDLRKSEANQMNTQGLQAELGSDAPAEGGEDERGTSDTAQVQGNESQTASGEAQESVIKQQEEMDGDNSNAKNNDVNPQRSLGDANKNWMSRLKNISDAAPSKESDSPENESNEQAAGQDFEYVTENQDRPDDLQALGVADKEQIDENMAIVDQNEEIEAAYMSEEEEKKTPEHPAIIESNQIHPPGKELNHQDGESKNEGKIKDDQDQVADMDDVKKAAKHEPELRGDITDSARDIDNLTIKDYNFDEQETKEYFELLELSLTAWRTDGSPSKGADLLWRNFTNLTQNLSFTLCEQLRLILEPTLATKLKGDYRTGKRLNMRKIIPYIASHFKKDKIWLRRTKPSKRTYQILLSVDDSKSMGAAHNVMMALQSLTTIIRALTILEVGEVGIVSFGEDVKLIHPFELPFTDESGEALLRAFTFEQNKTDVKLLMDQSLAIMRYARDSGNNDVDLWQLQVVLSDGKCESHEYIQARVRQAAEARIAMVFIILDPVSKQNSILTMDTVSYDVDPETCKPTLKMTRYMDTFPFDYYVVVEDVEMLPRVLSETLRQFFAYANC